MEQLDFVDYVQMGSALAVPAGNPKHISLDTLCGAKVAVLEGSYQLTVNIPPITDKCTADGKPVPQLFQFSDTHQAISSVLSDRTDVVYADQPILGYAAKQEPRIALAGISDIAPVSVGIAHDTGTLKAVSAALTAIVASPEYKKVLDKYGLTSMAITDPRVNAAQG
jgi:polar amino acid transport system substrate-binding protein